LTLAVVRVPIREQEVEEDAERVDVAGGGDLHDDAIVIDDHGDASSRSDREEECVRTATKVVFEPFMGIGPRRFFDLFSMKLSNGYPLKRKQKPDGTKVKWKISDAALVRVPMPRTTYLEREAHVVQLVTTLLKENHEARDPDRRRRDPGTMGDRQEGEGGGRELAGLEAQRGAARII